jgi:hypothetical protein
MKPLNAAYHEAGHAVVLHMLGIKVTHATILQHEDKETGDVIGGHVHWKEKVAGYGRWRNDAILLRRIVACYAGHAAQKKFSPKSVRKLHASDDNQSIKAYALAFCDGDLDEVKVLSAWLSVHAGKLVSLYWPSIEAIANELVIKKTLTMSEMLDIVSRLGWKALSPRSGKLNKNAFIISTAKEKSQPKNT